MWPEALAAMCAFQAAKRAGLPHIIASCSSGRELFERGLGSDIELAAQLNVSDVAPVPWRGGFRASNGRI